MNSEDTSKYLLVSDKFTLPDLEEIIEPGGKLVQKIVPAPKRTPFATELDSEADFAAMFWQNCPPPSMLPAIWKINNARRHNVSKLFVLTGIPGTFKTGLAKLFYGLTEGKSPKKGEGIIDMTNTEASKILFHDEVTSEGINTINGPAINAIAKDEVILYDEFSRSLSAQGLMDIFDTLAQELSVKSGEPLTIVRDDTTLGAKRMEVNLRPLNTLKKCMHLITLNPNTGMSDKELTRLRALRERYGRCEHQMRSSLTEKDYAHFISLQLCGIPLTTIEECLGRMPDPSRLIYLAKRNPKGAGKEEKHLDDLQMKMLLDPEATAEACRQIGKSIFLLDNLLKHPDYLTPEKLASGRELAELKGFLDNAKNANALDSEKEEIYQEAPTKAEISLRTVEIILRMIKTSNSIERRLNSEVGIVEDKSDEEEIFYPFSAEEESTIKSEVATSSKGEVTIPMDQHFGDRLAIGLQVFLTERFGDYPNVMAAASEIIAPVTGAIKTQLGKEAQRNTTKSARELLNFTKKVVIEEQTRKFQASLCEMIRRQHADKVKGKTNDEIIPPEALQNDLEENRKLLEQLKAKNSGSKFIIGVNINTDRDQKNKLVVLEIKAEHHDLKNQVEESIDEITQTLERLSQSGEMPQIDELLLEQELEDYLKNNATSKTDPETIIRMITDENKEVRGAPFIIPCKEGHIIGTYDKLNKKTHIWVPNGYEVSLKEKTDDTSLTIHTGSCIQDVEKTLKGLQWNEEEISGISKKLTSSCKEGEKAKKKIDGEVAATKLKTHTTNDKKDSIASPKVKRKPSAQEIARI